MTVTAFFVKEGSTCPRFSDIRLYVRLTIEPITLRNSDADFRFSVLYNRCQPHFTIRLRRRSPNTARGDLHNKTETYPPSVSLTSSTSHTQCHSSTYRNDCSQQVCGHHHHLPLFSSSFLSPLSRSLNTLKVLSRLSIVIALADTDTVASDTVLCAIPYELLHL